MRATVFQMIFCAFIALGCMLELRAVLDFSDATVNFQEFEGVDYKAMAGQGDMEFMQLMQDSMGKRERSGASYAERDFQRAAQVPSMTFHDLPRPSTTFHDLS